MSMQLDERGRHKAGCTCGFCKNMGSFGKKKDDGEKDKKPESTDESRITEKNWIKGAINPKHKGYCTPMTKSTCTPRRKALAKRFKSGDLHQENRAATIVSSLLEDEE